MKFSKKIIYLDKFCPNHWINSFCCFKKDKIEIDNPELANQKLNNLFQTA